MGKWTRERIIRDILSREAQGLPLNLSGDNPVELKLYQAASRIFGSWSNAVVAAGMPLSRSRSNGEWTTARIVAVIRALARRKSPLSAQEVKDRYGALVPAGRRLFGSWAKAVYAAGVDPQRLQRAKSWTSERVIEQILQRTIRNLPLKRQYVEPRVLVDAAVRLFGSWENALDSAGIDAKTANSLAVSSDSRSHLITAAPICAIPDTASRERGARWSEGEILAAVIHRFRVNKAMRATDVYREERSLYGAATRYFGNWRNTLIAAGIPIAKKKTTASKELPSAAASGTRH